MTNHSPSINQSTSELIKDVDYLNNATFLPFEEIVALRGNEKQILKKLDLLSSINIVNKEQPYGNLLGWNGYSIENDDLTEDALSDFAITENDLVVLPMESLRIGGVKIVYQCKILGKAPQGLHKTLKNYADFRNIVLKANQKKQLKSKRYLNDLTYLYMDLWHDSDLQDKVIPLEKEEFFKFLESL